MQGFAVIVIVQGSVHGSRPAVGVRGFCCKQVPELGAIPLTWAKPVPNMARQGK